MSIRQFTWTALAAWFAAIFALGAAGSLVSSQDGPPLPMLLSVVVPLVVFVAAYRGWQPFRAWLLSADLSLITAVQAWRTVGLAFLALFAYGLLPGVFALPAGLGDIAIALTAPWVAVALRRDRAYAGSRGFAVWNLLGILDLAVAVVVGGLSTGFLAGFTAGVTTAPLARLPLVLIPAYFVPLFIMLHLTALFQARRAATENRQGSVPRAAAAA